MSEKLIFYLKDNVNLIILHNIEIEVILNIRKNISDFFPIKSNVYKGQFFIPLCYVSYNQVSDISSYL